MMELIQKITNLIMEYEKRSKEKKEEKQITFYGSYSDLATDVAAFIENKSNMHEFLDKFQSIMDAKFVTFKFNVGDRFKVLSDDRVYTIRYINYLHGKPTYITASGLYFCEDEIILVKEKPLESSI